MGRNRFVQPETVRLNLSDGDWVEAKERLTYSEQQRLTGAMLRSYKGERGEQEIGVDWARFTILRLETWLTDWSFTDADDKRVNLSREAIENLDPATAEEIETALTAHIEAVEKKGTTLRLVGNAT